MPLINVPNMRKKVWQVKRTKHRIKQNIKIIGKQQQQFAGSETETKQKLDGHSPTQLQCTSTVVRAKKEKEKIK